MGSTGACGGAETAPSAQSVAWMGAVAAQSSQKTSQERPKSATGRAQGAKCDAQRPKRSGQGSHVGSKRQPRGIWLEASPRRARAPSVHAVPGRTSRAKPKRVHWTTTRRGTSPASHRRQRRFRSAARVLTKVASAAGLLARHHSAQQPAAMAPKRPSGALVEKLVALVGPDKFDRAADAIKDLVRMIPAEVSKWSKDDMPDRPKLMSKLRELNIPYTKEFEKKMKRDLPDGDAKSNVKPRARRAKLMTAPSERFVTRASIEPNDYTGEVVLGKPEAIADWIRDIAPDGKPKAVLFLGTIDDPSMVDTAIKDRFREGLFPILVQTSERARSRRAMEYATLMQIGGSPHVESKVAVADAAPSNAGLVPFCMKIYNQDVPDDMFTEFFKRQFSSPFANFAGRNGGAKAGSAGARAGTHKGDEHIALDADASQTFAGVIQSLLPKHKLTHDFARVTRFKLTEKSFCILGSSWIAKDVLDTLRIVSGRYGVSYHSSVADGHSENERKIYKTAWAKDKSMLLPRAEEISRAFSDARGAIRDTTRGAVGIRVLKDSSQYPEVCLAMGASAVDRDAPKYDIFDLPYHMGSRQAVQEALEGKYSSPTEPFAWAGAEVMHIRWDVSTRKYNATVRATEAPPVWCFKVDENMCATIEPHEPAEKTELASRRKIIIADLQGPLRSTVEETKSDATDDTAAMDDGRVASDGASQAITKPTFNTITGAGDLAQQSKMPLPKWCTGIKPIGSAAASTTELATVAEPVGIGAGQTTHPDAASASAAAPAADAQAKPSIALLGGLINILHQGSRSSCSTQEWVGAVIQHVRKFNELDPQVINTLAKNGITQAGIGNPVLATLLADLTDLHSKRDVKSEGAAAAGSSNKSSGQPCNGAFVHKKPPPPPPLTSSAAAGSLGQPPRLPPCSRDDQVGKLTTRVNGIETRLDTLTNKVTQVVDSNGTLQQGMNDLQQMFKGFMSSQMQQQQQQTQQTQQAPQQPAPQQMPPPQATQAQTYAYCGSVDAGARGPLPAQPHPFDALQSNFDAQLNENKRREELAAAAPSSGPTKVHPFDDLQNNYEALLADNARKENQKKAEALRVRQATAIAQAFSSPSDGVDTKLEEHCKDEAKDEPGLDEFDDCLGVASPDGGVDDLTFAEQLRASGLDGESDDGWECDIGDTPPLAPPTVQWIPDSQEEVPYTSPKTYARLQKQNISGIAPIDSGKAKHSRSSEDMESWTKIGKVAKADDAKTAMSYAEVVADLGR